MKISSIPKSGRNGSVVYLSTRHGKVARQYVLPATYALKRWDALTQFIEDGALEIDNNLIENAIRPSALGKKNF